MTPAQRQRIAWAPQLAVVHALRAVADATCASLAAAHPFANCDPTPAEDILAMKLYRLICRLDRAAAAYCDDAENLSQLERFPPTDTPF